MKKTSFYFLIIITIIISSCSKDKLEPEPKTSISDLSAFNTKDRIIGQVNGLYAAIKSGQYLGGRFLIYNDIRCENFLNQTTNSVTGYQTWGHTLNGETNEVTNLWNAVYLAINKINVFLEGLDASRENKATAALITEEEYNQFKGEALTLRALAYFHLLQLYAQPFNKDQGASLGVSLRLKGNKSSDDNDLARSSVAEVYTQITKDLDTAEPLVSTTFSDDLEKVTRVHRNTVIAIKTRVYLHTSNYAGVIKEGDKLIPENEPYIAPTGIPHQLQADIQSVFTAPYTTTESIFSMPFTSTDLPGTQNGLAHYYNPGPAGNGDYSLNPAGILGNSGWASTDSRRTLLLVNGTKTYLAKFPTGPLHTDYVPVIRYAEVLLNYAEASARQSGVNAKALNLLNAVHGRSNNGNTYNISDFPSASDLINTILLERNIEFLGEGLRSSDLLRTLSAIPGKSNINPVSPTAEEYIWPIPIQELLINKLMKSNAKE